LRRLGVAIFSSFIGCGVAAAIASSVTPAAAGDPAITGSVAGPVSGLPVPRFVSLKSDKVNVRGGPTRDHDVNWIYTRSGMPVEVTAESDNWRRIRDWEGAEGWVYHSMLAGKRTAITTARPQDKGGLLNLYYRADSTTQVVAQLQSGVVAQVKSCTGSWCRLVGPGFDGWAPQERLFGVYPNEKVE
jgi:SH3-like domain-containing protein